MKATRFIAEHLLPSRVPDYNFIDGGLLICTAKQLKTTSDHQICTLIVIWFAESNGNVRILITSSSAIETVLQGGSVSAKSGRQYSADSIFNRCNVTGM